ncbi:hypothetical protein NDU88_007599 [Pleurodeles waltl]|uniref:HAT C-terminal dimerisation domain-containing protein n=1 Tax=Pleurodeles waltl TaxID=8319 RepID=A0AAV7N4Q7_PLEWA|nr:hypothetical protein NDU88_007599 [Pleurodeles waltl]
MPRRAKNADDYSREHRDFIVEEANGRKLLVCKFCRVTVPVITGKTASRIAEHVSSKTHLKIKDQSMTDDGLYQVLLPEAVARVKVELNKEKYVAHEFARALVQSGTCLNQTDGPIGALFRKCASEGKFLPDSPQMYAKYLPDLFQADLEHISALIHGDKKISVSVDETLELHGNPAVAVLFTFCDTGNGWVRRTIMADLHVVETCNAVSIARLLQNVLEKFDKNWCDVLCICSDSTGYMKMFCNDLSKGMSDFRAFHIRDPCHLLDDMLKAALKSSELMRRAVDFVVHCSELFRFSHELKQKYITFCRFYGRAQKVMPAISVIQWPSMVEAVNAILSMWQPLTEFLLSDGATGKKREDLTAHIDSEVKKNTIYCTLRFLQENMTAIVDLIKKFKFKNLYIYQVYNIIGVDVKHLLELKLGDTLKDFGPVTCSLLECLPLRNQRTVEEKFRAFYASMHGKWQAMMCHNIPTTTSFEVNEASLWYSAQVLDPFHKGELSSDFEKYRFIFDRFNNSDSICTQFCAYIAEPVPGNCDLHVLQYWLGKRHQWPELADCVLSILALPVSSANVEMSFSPIKVLMGGKEKSWMSQESLKKYCMVYYNKFEL